MVSKSEFKSSSWRSLPSFPRGENINLLFISDIVNLPLKTNGGRDRRPIFCGLECFNY